MSQFWAGMDQFLWLIGEAVFHVGIPVGICWSVVRKMGDTPILGVILGLTLVSGQLLNAYAVATTPVDRIPHWDFGYFTVDMIGYQSCKDYGGGSFRCDGLCHYQQKRCGDLCLPHGHDRQGRGDSDRIILSGQGARSTGGMRRALCL